MTEGVLGNMDAAFEALELAYAERDPTLVVAKYWPGFDPRRQLPDDTLTFVTSNRDLQSGI